MDKIILETDEKLFLDETLKVFEGGEYNITDLVKVIKDGEDIPHYQYQANYIKNGEII